MNDIFYFFKTCLVLIFILGFSNPAQAVDYKALIKEFETARPASIMQLEKPRKGYCIHNQSIEPLEKGQPAILFKLNTELPKIHLALGSNSPWASSAEEIYNSAQNNSEFYDALTQPVRQFNNSLLGLTVWGQGPSSMSFIRYHVRFKAGHFYVLTTNYYNNETNSGYEMKEHNWYACRVE